MNCNQFESRIQHLLDSRINPQYDALLSHHARECRDCRLAMAVYACLEQAADAGGRAVSVPARQTPCHPLSPARIARRPNAARNPGPGFRFLAAAAAMVAIWLLPALPSSYQSPAWSPWTAQPAVLARATGPAIGGTPARPGFPSLAGEIPRWLPPPLSAVSLANVDLSEWSDIDVISLLPEEPLRTVRGIPETLATIEPFYRYSVELPFVNQWTGGLHFTIDLLRAKLIRGATSPSNSLDDLGRTEPGSPSQLA